jgi:uncharacterized protein
MTERLRREDSFRFRCDRTLSCFNQCCRDVNIILTPYDILRLKNRLGISSQEFLEKYTVCPFTKEQKIPVLFLRLNDQDEKRCFFVREEGCSVYADRPWACRMYPLGLASPKEGSSEQAFYFLMQEDVCQGVHESREWTVAEWLADQGIIEYDERGETFKELTLHDFLVKGGELGPRKMEVFYTACYNLDKFREYIFSNDEAFFDLFEVSENEKEALRNDDEALLRFALRWLRFSLFGEPVMTLTARARERAAAFRKTTRR